MREGGTGVNTIGVGAIGMGNDGISRDQRSRISLNSHPNMLHVLQRNDILSISHKAQCNYICCNRKGLLH